MARPPSTQPTDAELEILKVLWEQARPGWARSTRRSRDVARWR